MPATQHNQQVKRIFTAVESYEGTEVSGHKERAGANKRNRHLKKGRLSMCLRALIQHFQAGVW